MSGVIRYFSAPTGSDIRVSPTNPLPVGGGVASGSTDSGNPVKVAGVYNSTQPTLTNGQRGDLQLDTRANLRAKAILSQVAGSDGASNSVIGFANNVDASANVPTAVYPWQFNGATWDREIKPNAASRLPSSAATTNATSGKASAGNVSSIVAYNSNAAARFLKIYNKATAPTVGTDTPVLTIPLPPTSYVNVTFPNGGFYCSTGIAYALTTGAADADTAAVGAAEILGLNIAYS